MVLKDILNLQNNKGEFWRDYRTTLKPNYHQVYKDLVVCYGSLALGFYALFLSTRISSFVLSILFLLFVACWLGYWLHAILCFYHEAMHFNVAPNRRINDIIANSIMGILFGINIRYYRTIHWQHHQKLGEIDDPENSYQKDLSWFSIFVDITGLYVVKKLFFRKTSTGSETIFKGPSQLVFTLLSFICHLIVFVVLFMLSPLVSITWIFSFLGLFPLFNRIRQTLEHRSFIANPAIDYSQIKHGVTLRLFGKDFFSKTFGSAGFNWHLYHHMDPSISYTNFDEMAGFFSQTNIKEWIEENKSSYWQAFIKLCSRKRVMIGISKA